MTGTTPEQVPERFEDDEWFGPGYGKRFEDDDWDDPPGEHPEPTVDFVFDVDHARLNLVFTRGLWPRGLPELFLNPPPGATPADVATAARFAFFLAAGLAHLGRGLILATADPSPRATSLSGASAAATPETRVTPYETELDGRPARFWLAGRQAPDRRLARQLGAVVDTVIRVDCSLWHAPLLGE